MRVGGASPAAAESPSIAPLPSEGADPEPRGSPSEYGAKSLEDCHWRVPSSWSQRDESPCPLHAGVGPAEPQLRSIAENSPDARAPADPSQETGPAANNARRRGPLAAGFRAGSQGTGGPSASQGTGGTGGGRFGSGTRRPGGRPDLGGAAGNVRPMISLSGADIPEVRAGSQGALGADIPFHGAQVRVGIDLRALAAGRGLGKR